MTVNGYLRRGMNQKIFLVVNNPDRSSPQIIQHGSNSSFTHFKRIIPIIYREPALFVEVMDLIHMDKVIHE